MVSGRIRFKKIDSLGGENGKEEGFLEGLASVEISLVFEKGNYCFERYVCLSLVAYDF